MRKLLLFISIILPIYANAGYYDGNDLDKWGVLLNRSNNGFKLTDAQYMDISIYQGYVAGVYDHGDGVAFCAPDKTKAKQLTDIVTIYISNHPEKRNIQGADLVAIALSEKFPCKNNK